MTTLIIGKAPKELLPAGVIRCPCKTCKDSTLHERVVRKYWRDDSVWVKAKKNLKGYRGAIGVSTYRCQTCGEVRKY